jgi:branched-chain amino acid transport system substrate-binding protein
MTDLKKRLYNLCLVILMILVLVIPVQSGAAISSDCITVTVDDIPVAFDVPPRVESGRTLVPLRAIFEALQAEVKWDPVTLTVTSTKGSTTVSLTINSADAYVNGSLVKLDVPAKIIDGRTFVPLRFVGEALGAEVVWDGTTRSITITSDLIREYKMVSLLPLTGWLSEHGESSKVVSGLAAADINKWLEENDRKWRLKLVVEDTLAQPATALQKMRQHFNAGVRFFVGSMWSAEVKECLSFANTNKAVIVSPGSSAPELAIANDWLFRFSNSDEIEGTARANIAKAAGLKHLIYSWPGDAYSDRIQSASAVAARELGIEVYPQGVRYDPMLKDFTTQATFLNNYVTDLIAKGFAYGEIGIVADEVGNYLDAANTYPQLKKVVWIGRGTLSTGLVSSSFGAASKYICPLKLDEKGTRYNYVKDYVQRELGREPDYYSYMTYDAVWSLAMAIDKVGYNSAKVRDILPRVTDEWTKQNGASGHIVLNAAGDRAYADFDLWMFTNNRWERVGVYNSRTKTVNWIMKVF